MDGIIIVIIVIVFLFLIILSNLSLYLCFYYRPPNPPIIQVPPSPDPPPVKEITILPSSHLLDPTTQGFTCPPDKPILINGQCHPSPQTKVSKIPYTIYR